MLAWQTPIRITSYNVCYTKLLRFVKTFPFIISALIYLIIRFNVLDQTTTEGASNILNNIIYATEGSERFASNLNVWINYLKLTFYPFHLSYDYSYNQIPIVDFTNFSPIFSLIIFALLIWIAIKSLKTRSIVGFGICRITSYNVCYTKLLRTTLPR